MNQPLLEVKDLKTYFYTFRGVVKAVDGISFTVEEGEVLGIVGESGSGKSVTSFSIMKLIDEPGKIDADVIRFGKHDILKTKEKDMVKIRGKEISMIFQDPMTSLNPVYSVEEQMTEMLDLHQPNLSSAQKHEKCVDLMRQVGIPNPEERLKSYPHQFSGGMRQRVVIAIALAASPKMIIADEPTTALDVTIQAQILKLMVQLVRKNNAALMLITHDLAVVAQMADEIIVMYCGKIVESGTKDDVIHHPMHPYTVGLLGSIPRMGTNQDRLQSIPGIVPSLLDMPPGCAFAPRCRYADEQCRQQPEMICVGGKHKVSCFHMLKESLDNE